MGVCDQDTHEVSLLHGSNENTIREHHVIARPKEEQIHEASPVFCHAHERASPTRGSNRQMIQAGETNLSLTSYPPTSAWAR